MNLLMNRIGRMWLCLSLMIAALVSMGSVSVPAAHADSPAPAQDLLYAVDNSADNGTSQLYTINPQTLQAVALGPQTPHDFEDVAISIGSHDLFASTGGDVANDKGRIYRVDGVTGAVTLLGPSGFDRITIMKFRALDDTLWGWAEGKGLVQLDEATGKGTLVFKSSKKFEGMAWQPDGKLYLAISTKLSVLDLSTKKLTEIATNLPKGTESLASFGNGKLLGGVGSKNKSFLYSYRIADKQVEQILTLTSPFKSIEGLCVPSTLI